jgi:glycopeptide antibiotics resistance protein
VQNVPIKVSWGSQVRFVLRGVLVCLLLVELAGIAWLVLNPDPDAPTTAVLDVSAWLTAQGAPEQLTDTTVVGYLLNVSLFVPLGLLCALLFPRVPLSAWGLLGILISGALEMTQLEFLPERQASGTDFVANTVGMFLGAAPVVVTRRLLRGVRHVRRWHLARTGALDLAPEPTAPLEPLV